MSHYPSYLSPKCEVRPVFDDQLGVFALEPIAPDELVAVWGGLMYTADELHGLPPEVARVGIQVEEGLYLVSIPPSPADRINHSCDPNAGIIGQIVLVAMRPIAAGEQVCFDYAMSDGSPYDEFDCACGASTCRGHVTGEDWRLPSLQQRYRGYFSLYLQRRIDSLSQ